MHDASKYYLFMKTFRYDKLVRDKTLECISNNQGSCDFEILEGKKKLKALKEKCFEEINELFDAKTKDDQKEEFADIFEVLYTFANVLGISLEEIEKKRQSKNTERGSFQKGIFIKSATLPSSSRIYQYLLSNPDKYPEI